MSIVVADSVPRRIHLLPALACELLGHPPAFLAEWDEAERQGEAAKIPPDTPYAMRHLRCDRCGFEVFVAVGRSGATTSKEREIAAAIETEWDRESERKGRPLTFDERYAIARRAREQLA